LIGTTKQPPGLQPLIGTTTGVLSDGARFLSYRDEPRLVTRVVSAGDLSQVWSLSNRCLPAKPSRPIIRSSGSGIDDDEALTPALAEGLERYCTVMYPEEQVVVASATELGQSAINLDVIPRCSATELAHPKCPLVPPDKSIPIRWVKALSLLSFQTVYVPLVMVYLHTGLLNASERICVQITTGSAAHSSYEKALLSAVLEIIERDALSVLWLQKMSLPRIELDRIPGSVMPYWEQYDRSSRALEYVFFDATTDFDVPTIYGVQISHMNSRLHTLVSCSSALDPAIALAKVMRDMAACRILLRYEQPIPSEWDTFKELHHGAAFMARAEQASAFDFLLKSDRRILFGQMRSLNSGDVMKDLERLLSHFRSKGMEVLALDLTTDEALRLGMRVVRVIIPNLQPFSYHYLAQYKAHPRLYELPRLLGHPVHAEHDLNHWPQPFA
jgi:ribosomal protein S12 methylthiotransferase accessory factor